eukprot:CAMPEP_0184479840 /NCGR_PEP_ID=MMETSP0113_2-20130426/1406_1 /TAXON_ID=91329 /ORGANISM="Norrisiella sphaerica, Strain BC52" /LENGTH=200 /DNA_ID=CAMNT_0026858001 /DNA_START=563 /DNA_END=1165 /DNA_ORIENTATION=-
MGARKHRRYLNSILLMGDQLAAGELSQSEIECEEEEFPDFADYKGYFVSACPEFRNGDETGHGNYAKIAKNPSVAETDFAEMLKKRFSKSTRRLILRSCIDSKFFEELEGAVIAHKMDRKVDQTPTTFTLLEDPASKDIIAFKQFDSFQRFLAHRVAKFHDLQSKSCKVEGKSGLKDVEMRRSDQNIEHHTYRMLEVLSR